ncbi:hypothetical protein E4U47_000971 [Claviceps purpurea]|nr:hypothetical protein E4U47_000971 [Claviceps purpurea]
MSHKNWNDRADKDLFFTILSLKDVGLISGEEWCRIGNHMRSLGYRFTNEGCRQHFQGLRRTQNKAAVIGTAVVANPYHTDPTLNPVTRRSGPGRGRPKKHSLASAPEVGQPVVKHTYSTILPRPVSVHLPAPAPEQHIRQAGEAVVDHGAPSQPHGAPIHVGAFSSAYTSDVRHVSFRAEGGGSSDGVRTGNCGGNRDESEGAVGRFGEERAVKRRRFEEPPDLEHSVPPSAPPSAPPLASASAPFSAPPLAPPEEEAVLVLAAHTGASGPNLQGNTIGSIGQWSVRPTEVRRPKADLRRFDWVLFGVSERLLIRLILTAAGTSGKTSANKRSKTGLWGDPAFLQDLVMCFYLAGTEARVMTPEGVLLLLRAMFQLIEFRTDQYIQKLRRGHASAHEEQVTVANGGISEPATPGKRKIPVKKAASAKAAKYDARDRQSDDEGDYILSVEAEGAEPVTPSSGCTNNLQGQDLVRFLPFDMPTVRPWLTLRPKV